MTDLPKITPVDRAINTLERTIKDLQLQLAALKATRGGERKMRDVALPDPRVLRGERK